MIKLLLQIQSNEFKLAIHFQKKMSELICHANLTTLLLACSGLSLRAFILALRYSMKFYSLHMAWDPLLMIFPAIILSDRCKSLV